MFALLVVSCVVFLIETTNADHDDKKTASGNPVLLPCTITALFNGDSLPNWWHKRLRSDTLTEIVINGSVVNALNGRFIISGRPLDRNFSLIIISPSPADAGIYICAENEGFGPFHEIYLTVENETEHTPLSEQSSSTSSQTKCIPMKPSAPDPDNSGLHHITSCPTIVSIVTCIQLQLVILSVAVWVIHKKWNDKKTADHRVAKPERQLMIPKLPGVLSQQTACGCTKTTYRDPSPHNLGNKEKCWHDIYEEFPEDGIGHKVTMRDFYELVRHPDLFHQFIAMFASIIRQKYRDVNVIVSLDTHGFMFGLLTAQELRKPFVPVRKLRTLPGATVSVPCTSTNEGNKIIDGQMWIQESAIRPGQQVVIVDEKLATGGSLKAAFQLMNEVGAVVCGCFVVVEDKAYNGRQVLRDAFPDIEVLSMLVTESDTPKTSSFSPERDVNIIAVTVDAEDESYRC